MRNLPADPPSVCSVCVIFIGFFRCLLSVLFRFVQSFEELIGMVSKLLAGLIRDCTVDLKQHLARRMAHIALNGLDVMRHCEFESRTGMTERIKVNFTQTMIADQVFEALDEC